MPEISPEPGRGIEIKQFSDKRGKDNNQIREILTFWRFFSFSVAFHYHALLSVGDSIRLGCHMETNKHEVPNGKYHSAGIKLVFCLSFLSVVNHPPAAIRLFSLTNMVTDYGKHNNRRKGK